MDGSPHESPALDPAVPNVARMYDYMLGGKNNYASDRAPVAELMGVTRAAPESARHNRAFLGRAVGFAASQSVSQFLDVGAGLPTQQSVHEVARTINPAARIAYVDNDPVVAAHSVALLGGAQGVTFVQGDIRDPASLLGNPEISGLL